MLKNKAIESYWQNYLGAGIEKNIVLPHELSSIVSSKFVELFGAAILESTIPPAYKIFVNGRADFSSLPGELRNTVQDKTGLECQFSKIHIDGLVEDSHFQIAMLFLANIFEIFSNQYPSQILRGIIAINDDPNAIYSCCVFFHLLREDEWWIDEDEIENYKEGVFVIDSNERLEIGD